TKRRHLEQQFTRGMATTFGDERTSRFTAQAGQVIEFREEPPGASLRSSLWQLREPRLTLPHLVHISPGAGDSAAPVQGFDPIHHARRVLYQILIASDQLLQIACAVLAVV